MSELWETTLVLKLTQRSGVSFFTKFHMLVSDWGLKPAVVMCQPANAIAFSAFEHVSMDNVQVCVNKRGDDKTLGLLTYARRCELGELAEKHYAAVKAEAEASGSFTADQLQSRMARERLAFSVQNARALIAPLNSELFVMATSRAVQLLTVTCEPSSHF